MQYSKTVLTHLRSVVIIKRGGDLQHSEDFYIKHIFLGGVEMSKLFKKKFFCLFLLVILAVSIATPFTSVFAAESYMIGDTQINVYELINCQNILRAKANPAFTISDYKLLYGLDNENSYIAVYDDDLHYFAVYHRDSGIIMERANRSNPYEYFTSKKCYYGGFGVYMYEDEGKLYDISSGINYDKEAIIEAYEDEARSLNQRCINSSCFSSKEQIINANKNITQVESMSTNSNSFEVSFYNMLYAIMISNNTYTDSASEDYYGQTCDVGSYTIGYNTFPKYGDDENGFDDIIHPINDDGVCGEVAGTMLLQYYERNGIVQTVPEEFYDQAVADIESDESYSEDQILSEIIKNSIHSFHNEVFGGSTYVSIKDAINDYFEHYNINGISISSSILTYNIKSTIDSGEPCAIFAGTGMYVENFEQSGLVYESFVGHALFCYGYSLNQIGGLDELLCHTGWTTSEYTNCLAYVAACNVAGNIRLLH